MQKNMNLVTHVFCNTKLDLYDHWLEPEPNDSASLEKNDRKDRERLKAFISSYCSDTNELGKHRRETSSIVLQARDELNEQNLCIGGGTVRDELYRSELDSQFCKNYETWLLESIDLSTGDDVHDDAELPLFQKCSISFTEVI